MSAYTAEWTLSEPNVAIADGVVSRMYWLTARGHGRTLAAATLSVLFWLAPKGRWGEVSVMFEPLSRPEPRW